MKIECASISVRNHLLEQARNRKPTGIYLAEFPSTDKLSLYRRINELKREYPNKVRAVYIRKGDIFCKTEPNGEVLKIANAKIVDELRSQFTDRPADAVGNGANTAE